jgi:hypothetical protein
MDDGRWTFGQILALKKSMKKDDEEETSTEAPGQSCHELE